MTYLDIGPRRFGQITIILDVCNWGVPAWHFVVDDLDALKLVETCWE